MNTAQQPILEATLCHTDDCCPKLAFNADGTVTLVETARPDEVVTFTVQQFEQLLNEGPALLAQAKAKLL